MSLASRLSGLWIGRASVPKVHLTNGNLIQVPVPAKAKVKSYELQDGYGRRVYPS